jgi:branched-subunit amino acid ABC-type transport system permease component
MSNPATPSAEPAPRARRVWQWIAAVVGIVALADLALFALGGDGGGALLTQQIINALTLGGIYALIAVGYTLIYGIVKLINFAHGEIYMLGAMFGILLIGSGVTFWIALPLAMVACGVVSVTMDQVAYRPLRQQFHGRVLVPLMLILAVSLTTIGQFYLTRTIGWPIALTLALTVCVGFIVASEKWAYTATVRQSPRLAALITAIGMSLVLQNGAMLLFGAQLRPFSNLKPETTLTLGPWDDQQRAMATTEVERALTASKEGRLDEVPFHYAYRMQRTSVEFARKRSDADLPDRERSLDKTRADLPVVEWFKFNDATGGTLTLTIAFRLGAGDADISRYCVELQQWLSNSPTHHTSPGIGCPTSMDSTSAQHVFQTELLEVLGIGIDGVSIPVKVLFIWLATAGILIGMNFVVHRTRLGMAMRACALDRDAASLMGVNVNRVIAVTFLLSGAMAAVAGILYGLYIGGGIFYRMGYYAGVMAFFAAVLGGIGNLKGAVLGGMILGGVQALSKAYVTDWLTLWIHRAGNLIGADLSSYNVNSSYDYAIACLILITVILIRPTGLLGSKGADRA